jgi:hypothetical protein
MMRTDPGRELQCVRRFDGFRGSANDVNIGLTGFAVVSQCARVMKLKKQFAVAVAAIPLSLAGSANAVTVVVDTAIGAGVSSVAPIPVSTGAVRASAAAPAANATVPGTLSAPEVTGPAQSADAPATTASRATQGPSSSRSGRTQRVVPATPSDPGAAPSAKGAIAPEIVYDDPGALRFSAEAGYASKHLWRGIDLAQFTSFNHLVPGVLPKADSDVAFVGFNTSYQGFSFGLKYIETLDDNFNPFFAPFLTDLDSYEELVVSLSYTRMLMQDNWLQGTFGFDFYYYPNGEFWGVDHQGLLFARLSSPRYKWAQPFIELFYNVATDSSGNGLADSSLTPPPGFTSFRGAEGSDLIEGGGFELGVNGADRVFANDKVSVALTYSLSTFFKSGYAFEDDGFSHLVITVGSPVTIGENLTITPSVTYTHALGDISPVAGAVVPGGDPLASAWNEPGWSAAVKASWQF